MKNNKLFMYPALSTLFIAATVFSVIPAYGNSVDIKNASESAEPSECIVTDVKGHLEYTGNHVSGNPVIGYFDNISDNNECSDEVTFHVFGSMHKEPEKEGWLESQEHVTSKTFTIPEDATNNEVSFTVPNSGYCWYQVEATRTQEVKIPPYYNGDELIDYVFVKDTDSCVEATPTPTPTLTPTPEEKVTPTPTPEKKEEAPKQEVLGITEGGTPVYEKPVHVPKTPNTGAGTFALASLLPGGFIGMLLRRRR